jgi:hypothetical protein
MKFLFKNESFSFEALRGAGFAAHGGSDLGEVLVAAKAIPEGDEAAWLKSWERAADRVAGLAESSLARGHKVSAREAFFRASNYYRDGRVLQTQESQRRP